MTTSCSSEDAPEMKSGEGTTFRVTLPEDLSTRAFGDGLSATQLQYAVYVAGTNELVTLPGGGTVGTADFNGLEANITISFPRGKKYDIVFWAQKPGSEAFAFNAADRKVNIFYDKMTQYSEDNDAFCFTLKEFSSTGADTRSVTLYRPLAQLNIGTADYQQAADFKYNVTETSVLVKNLYSTIDLGAEANELGEATGETADVQFPMTALPEGENFPYNNPDGTVYKYLSMNYVLVPAEKMITTVTLRTNDDVVNEEGDFSMPPFNNVPLQRNHRTNIFGNLLTSPTDFTVTIDERFDVPDYNIEYTEVAVSNSNDLRDALTKDNVYIRLTKDIPYIFDAIYTVTGKNVIIDGQNHKVEGFNSYFDIKGSCERFEIRNCNLILARGTKQSIFYVNEAGTKEFIMTGCSLDHWTWDGVQILSNTLENVIMTKNNFSHRGSEWPPARNSYERSIHVQILDAEGHNLYPASNMKLNISENVFNMPGYVHNEFVGVYNVNPEGITFRGNRIVGTAIGNNDRPMASLFNFWTLDAEGEWVEHNDLFDTTEGITNIDTFPIN